MKFTFSADEATALLAFLSSIVVPFVTSWLKQNSWPSVARFAVAVLLSVAGGLLSAYLAGTFASGASVILAIIAVFGLAQANYASWFQGLGLEDWLNPPTPPTA